MEDKSLERKAETGYVGKAERGYVEKNLNSETGNDKECKDEIEEKYEESLKMLARNRRLAEFKNLCILDGEIHNWWEGRFYDVPDKGPFKRTE